MFNFLRKIFKTKVSCEDPRKIYVCLPFIRLIYVDGKYEGWYRP